MALGFTQCGKSHFNELQVDGLLASSMATTIATFVASALIILYVKMLNFILFFLKFGFH
jgi:hypothetical protein